MPSAGQQQVSLDDGEVIEQGAFTEINIVPLVDIMLVLLVILMATSTAILESGQGSGQGFKVELPTGAASEKVTEVSDQLVISILPEGQIFSRGELRSIEELKTLLQEEAKKNSEQVVLIQADEEAKHKRVVEVMETARAMGLKNLAIATRPSGAGTE